MGLKSYIDRRFNAARAFALRLARETRGFAAVEFAMVVPVMIIMLLGCVEVSDASIVSLRMINISGAVGSMVARCGSVDRGDLNDIMDIASALLGHYAPEPFQIDIVTVKSDANGNVTVYWSYDRSGGSPLAPGTPYTTLPGGLISANGGEIIVTATYNYRSPVGQYIHGTVPLWHTAYNAPQTSAVPPDLGNVKCSW